MKKYTKPQITEINYSAKDNLSSLNDWLANNNLDGAGITTYVVNS